MPMLVYRSIRLVYSDIAALHNAILLYWIKIHVAIGQC